MIFENHNTIIISDPWIHPGAFDDSWFQYPRNDHMREVILSKIENLRKNTYIFVSHEHIDHFDPRFLNSLPNRNFTVIIADYRRPFMLEWFQNYKCKNIICLKDAKEYMSRYFYTTSNCINTSWWSYLDIDVNNFIKTKIQKTISFYWIVLFVQPVDYSTDCKLFW